MFLGVIIGTLVLVVGVSVLLGGNNTGTTSSTNSSQTVSADILVHPDSWQVATSSAKVTVVEFSDFECPACTAAEPEVETLRAKYQGQVNFVYRHFPLPAHDLAFGAAEAAEAAGLQGKFWQMHDALFQNSPNLSRDQLEQYAKSLGLDMTKFDKDFDSDQVRLRVTDDQNDGNKANVNATPTFFVNGHPNVGIDGLDQAISSALK